MTEPSSQYGIPASLPVASPATYLILIDSRVSNYQDIINAKQPGVYHIVFDAATRPTHSAKLIKDIEDQIAALGVPAFTSIGLVQHNDGRPIYEMFGRISDRLKPVISGVATRDPDIQSWNRISLFITMLRLNYGIVNFDMMACALYSDPNWKYVIDKLTAVTGVTVRASTDDTGAASLGGDWFLESHTGANLKEFYFTEAIENYTGVLYTAPSSQSASAPPGATTAKKLILIDNRIKDIDVIINAMNEDTYCLVFNYFYDTPASILSKLRFLTGNNRYILDNFHYEPPTLPTRMDASGNHCTPCDDFDTNDIQLVPGILENEYLEYTMSGGDASGNGGVWPFYSESTNITIQKPVFFQRAKIGETTESVPHGSTDGTVVAATETIVLNYKPRPMVLVSDLDAFYELGQNVGEIGSVPVAFDCVGIIQHTIDPTIGYKFVGGSDDTVAHAIVQDVVSRDSSLSSWAPFTAFIQAMKTAHQMTMLDLMACALYANPDWKFVIDTLAVRENITIRASLDNTGSGTDEDEANWVLETDNVSLTTVYFTDKIYEWKYVLATYIDSRFNALRWNDSMYATRGYDSRLKIAAGTANFTIEAWYYETTSRTNCTLVDMGDYNYTFQIRNSNLTNPQGMSFYNSSLGNWLYAESAVVPVAQWSHIAITRSGSTFTFYINGIARQTFTNSASLYSNNSTFAIGWQSPDTCLCNRMKLDTVLYDIRLWNVARTATEILMNRNRIVPANSTGLVANYLCTDNGSTLNDRTANALHTTIQNYNSARWSNNTVPIPNIGFLINNGYSLTTSSSSTALNAFTHFDNITYTDFSGVDLSGVNFRGADLTGCNFTNANLTNTNFANAYLINATTTNAITTGSNIARAITNLTSTVVNFDGVDDGIIAPEPSWSNQTQYRTTFTSEVWFKTSDTGSQKATSTFVAQYGLTPKWRLHIRPNGTVEMWLVTTGGWDMIGTPLSYNDALWHHLAATYNSSNGLMTLYIDGVSVVTKTHAYPGLVQASTSNTPIMMGSDYDGTGFNHFQTDRQFRGAISDVRIWNVVRTAAEIAANYQQRLSGNETGLLGYWKLNQGYGSGWATYNKAIDSTSYRSVGTLTNMGATPSGSWVVSNINFQPRISAITLGPNNGTYNADVSFSFIDPSSNSLGNFTYSVSPTTVATVANGTATTKTIYATSGAISIPTFSLYDFPEIASLSSWQIDVSFTVTSGDGSWRALIGDMYNNVSTGRGWGMWVSATTPRKIHWSWSGTTMEPAQTTVALNTPYVLSAAQNSGTITLTLRNMADTYDTSSSISNLVASYLFDSNANDTSTNSNNLTNVNSVTYNTTDYKRGSGAASFNGSNYFQITNDGRFSPDNLTIAFWIKPLATSGTHQALASCRNNSNGTGWFIYIAPNNNLEFFTGPGGSWIGGSVYNNFGGLFQNIWVHIAITVNKTSSSFILYINGSSYLTSTRTYVNNTGTNMRIGAGANEGSADFIVRSGTLIDDFRIYNKVLTATEVSSLVSPISNIVAWYSFDNNSNDASPNNNNLTNTNAVTYNTTDYKRGTAAASFNGSNHFQINNDGRFSPDNFTVACWIKPVDSAGNVQSIATCRDGYTFKGWMIYIGGSNDLQFITGSGSGWSYNADTLLSNIGTINTWVHIAFTFSKSTNTGVAYINGNLQATITRTYTNNTSYPLRIGAGGDYTYGELFLRNGTLIDDFRFYNKVLTAAEIGTIVAGSSYSSSFSVGANVIGKGPVTIGGWHNYSGENFPGTISYVNVSVPTNQRVVTLASSTDGTPATVTATQASLLDYSSGSRTASLTVNKATPTFLTSFANMTKTFNHSFAFDVPLSNSTGAFSFTSSNTAVATINPAVTINALQFNGTSNFVDFGANIVELGKSSFTIELWVKTNGTRMGILNCQDSDSTWETGEKSLYIDADGIPVFVGFGCNFIYATEAVNDNTWHHIAVTWLYTGGTSGTPTFYIDGINRTGTTHPFYSIYPQYTANTFNLGTFVFGKPTNQESVNFFNGAVCELRIWNVARSATEIFQNYRRMLVGNETGLVAYNRFNQGIASGTNTDITRVDNSDISGGYTGVLSGSFTLTGSLSNWVTGISIRPVYDVNVIAEGTTTITAIQASSPIYLSQSTTATLTVTKTAPTIGALTLPTDKRFGDVSFNLTAPTSNVRASNVITSTASVMVPPPDVNTLIYGSAWTKLGGDIDGEAAGDQSGYNVAISADGTVVAIGAKNNDGSGNLLPDSGHVRVYRYTPSKTVAVTDQNDLSFGPIGWTRMGADIDGEGTIEYSGMGVSISADGTTVAIGAHGNDGTSSTADNAQDKGSVRVYRYDPNKMSAQMDQTLANFGPRGWNRLGGDIDGETTADYFGISVSLSADGSVVAIGGVGNDGDSINAVPDAFYVRTGGSNWRTFIPLLTADTTTNRLGWNPDAQFYSVATAPSNEIAMQFSYFAGYWLNANRATNGQSFSVPAFAGQGSVGTFVFTATSNYPVTTYTGRLTGYSTTTFTLTPQSDGISAGQFTTSGHVRVFRYTPGKGLITDQNDVSFGPVGWTRLGKDINGEATSDESGYSVSLSADGTVVAIGARYNDGSGNLLPDSGHVRVYRYTPSKTVAVPNQNDISFGPVGWTRMGADIDGEGNIEYTGWSVALSADGTTVAIGAVGNDANSTSVNNNQDRGNVRVYRYDASKVNAQMDQTLANFGPRGWTRLGGDIDGDAIADYLGWSVSLSADGTIVACGGSSNDAATGNSADNRGHVRIFKYNPNKLVAQTNEALAGFGPAGWDRIGDDIDGETAGDESGVSVSLSSDGTTVAIGGYKNDGTSGNSADNRGHIRVYNIPTTNALTYSSSNSSVADVCGNLLLIKGVNGSSTITASQTTNTVTGILDVSGTTYTLTYNPTTYTSSNTSVATVSTYSGTVNVVGAGTTTITASQGATRSYTSRDVSGSLVIATAAPTIGALTIANVNFGVAPFTLTAPSTNSSGAFSYTSSNTAVATVTTGGTVTVVGAGTTTITATQAASGSYAAGSVTASLVVSPITPTIGTLTIPSKTFGDGSFNITNPTSNSTGLFSYVSSNTNVATVTKITFTTTSLLARYDTSQPSNYTLSGSTVTQWNDLTGNGYHLTQNGTGPTLTTINSITAFDFNSSKGFIRASVPLSSTITVFMVIKYSTNIGTWGSFMHHGHRDSDWAIERNSWPNAMTSHNLQFQSNNVNGPPELSTSNNVNYILIGRINGSTREFWRYSDTQALGFTTGTTVSIVTGNKTVYVGKSDNNEACNSTIGEILYYNSTLSNADVSANLNYLQNKWFNNLDTPSFLTIVGSGSSTITATQDATTNYTSGSVSASLVVSPSAPTFGAFTVPVKYIFDNSFTLTPPTSNSNGAFTFSTDASGSAIATVTSGGIVTLTGVAGTATITVTQSASANGNYTSRTVTGSLVVNAALSNFTVPSNKVYADAAFDLTDPTTIYSGEPFIFTSSDTTVASIGGAGGRTVTIHKAGSTTITAKQVATGAHSELTITAVLVIAKKTTVITLSAITKNHGDASFNISPSSSNTDTLTPTFSITSRNPDIISIFDVSYAAIRGIGSVLIDISQSETTNFTTATATIMITVNKGNPVLSAFTVSTTRTYSSTPFSAVAYPTSVSNGAIVYSSSDSTVATIDSSGIITLLKAGYVNFTATQQATAYYNSTTKTTNTMTVIRQALALVRSSPTASTINKTYGDGYFNVIATNDSNGGTITYETNNPSVAGIVGSATAGLISVVSAGTATITARRGQTDQYTSDPVSWTVEVARTTTTLSGLSDLSYNVTAAPFTVTASSASNGAVTYSLQDPSSQVLTIHPTSGLVTLRSPGSAVIVASQAQGTNYFAPASITATITVSSAGNALQGATITSTASFAAVNLEGASLAGVSITNTAFTAAKLTNANLTNAVIVSANFASADLSGATLAGATITGATFTAASLKNADLSGAVLTNTAFTGSDLSGAKLTGVDASGASFANAKLNNVDLTGANIANVNFTNTSIKGAIIDDISFSPLQKLQLLKNSENRDIGQIIIPEVTGTTVLAAISETSPLRAIQNLDLATATVAVVVPTTSTSPTDVLPDVVLNVANSDKFYLPINESEFFQIEGVKYYATGGVVRNYLTNAVVEVISYNGTPVWLLAGSIVGLVLQTNTLNSSQFVIPSRKLITDTSPFMPTTLPTSNNTETPIVYSSSNTNIATINSSSGEITVTGNFTGFVHFTATQVQNATYEPGTSVSNTLFVDRAINFSLSGLNQTFNLSTLVTLDASSISVDATDATAIFYVRLSDINNIFMYQSDATDITNVSADDMKYYVFHRKWPTELKLNPTHAMMNKTESAGMLGIGDGYTNDKSLAKHDFIRYIALRLFNTIHAVDLFHNETELHENSVFLGETVRNNIDTILSGISTTSSSGTMSYDASGNKYLTNDASGNTNLCREIMRHIAAVAPSRFYGNIPNHAGLKNVPFIENDTLQYKLVVQAAASQNMLTGVSVIPSRSYTIKLVLKNTVNSNTNANSVISDSIMYPNSYPYSSSVMTYPPTSDSSGVYNLYSPPAPIPFARFGYNGWYYTNSTTWVNVAPAVRNHIKWLVGGNTATSKVGDLQYVRINLKIHNTTSLPYVMIYTQAGSSRKYAVVSGNGSLTNGTVYSFYMNFNSYAREPAYIGYTNAALGYTIGTGSFANNETITSIALESDSNAAASNVEFTLSSIVIGELSTTTNLTSEKEYGFEAAVPEAHP